jgi:hypothetical protein
MPHKILGGSVIVDMALYRANRDNVHGTNLNDYTEGGNLSIDTTAESMGSMDFRCNQANLLVPYRDWVAPKMSLTTPDHRGQDSETTTAQIGLFMVLPPSEEWTAMNGEESIQCTDSLGLMQLSLVDKTYVVAQGANIVTHIRSLITGVGLRAIVQSSSETMTKKQSWDIGTSRLQIANELCKKIGFEPLFIDRFGRVHSHRKRRMSQVEPSITISSAAGDVYDTVTLEPDIERLCNHVVVLGKDTKGTKLKKVMTNKDRSSPTSIWSLGEYPDNPTYITKYEENQKLDKQSAVDARAETLLERGGSVMERLQVVTNPHLFWQIHETVRVDIETDDGVQVANDVYRWEKIEMGLGIDAQTTWTLARVQRWKEINT